MGDRKRIAIVSSVGGHLTEIVDLRGAFGEHDIIWILNDESPVLPADVSSFRITHAERDWRVLWNVVEIAAVLARERPDVVVSAGASPAVCAALVARLAGIPFVYFEPWSAVTHPTLTGRLMRWLTPYRFARWPDVARRLRAKHIGGSL
ncbi:MAG: hypothetical protein FWD17_05975 [Polyangiaceae bacterium]|nr:hypothetical protein [Polyangiaceae bacterium]